MTVLLDDHLLRDWLAGPDPALRDAIGDHQRATTNLWYARLCKSAAKQRGGALLGGWSPSERDLIVGSLVALPVEIVVTPMRALAWRMGVLGSEHQGISALGAEAVAAAESLDATVLVASRDDGPGIRRCCAAVGVAYRAVAR
jgi:hypothetical protein